MTSNFFLNNVFTYGDQRLRGRRLWRGLAELLRRLRHRRVHQHRAGRVAVPEVGRLLGGGAGRRADRRALELLHHRLVHLGRLERRRSADAAPADWLHARARGRARCFALYALTAPRTVGLEDDGLFVLSSYFLGIEHPPGYPLFTLIGHLFSLLPVGSVAYRVHLASALFGALSGARGLAVRAPAGRWRGSRRTLAAFALGLSPVFWSQSIIAEVYTLNTFFFLVLGLARAAARPGALPWIALVFGLSLSNHWPLMLLVAPAFAVLLWPLRAELLRRAWLLAGLVLLGLAALRLDGAAARWRAAADQLLRSARIAVRDLVLRQPRRLRRGRPPRPRPTGSTASSSSRFFGRRARACSSPCSAPRSRRPAFVVQWRAPRALRIAAFLTVAFLMPSVGAAAAARLRLRRDPQARVPRLPAAGLRRGRAVGGPGLCVADRALRAARAFPRAAAAALVLGAELRRSARAPTCSPTTNGARATASTVLALLPPNAVVLTRGRGRPRCRWRTSTWSRTCGPTSRSTRRKGLVLGNRLFNPARTDEDSRQRILRRADRAARPRRSSSRWSPSAATRGATAGSTSRSTSPRATRRR